MFIHSFRYALKQLTRQKGQMFWNLLFPIILGSLFYLAFSGLSAEGQFHAIPVAVVVKEQTNADSFFQSTMDTLGKPGKNQFLKIQYTTEKKALSLLKSKKISGILYDGTPLSLTISGEMTSAKLDQSILNAFVEQYNMNHNTLKTISITHPEKQDTAIKALALESNYHTETSYSSGNMDERLSYFFNLIAMSCLYAYIGGLTIVLRNQANLSALGARKGVSPVHKLVSLLGELCASFVYNFSCVFASLLYLIFVLKINFGDQVGYIILASLVGCITGVSFGFFIGSFGKLSESTKQGILMASAMISCFLSGLMVGNIRIYIEKICPWFNRINPAALISDSFYSLTVYQSHQRYFSNLTTLLILSAGFCVGGFLMVRREKYAAL